MIQHICEVFDAATLPLPTMTPDTVYSSYEIGYLGDKAGVSLTLTTPRRGESVQHLKHGEIRRVVMTTSEFYELNALQDMVQNNAFGPEDAALLKSAYCELSEFIGNNGRYKPMSVLDLEGC